MNAQEIKDQEIEKIFLAYVETALWSSHDLQSNYGPSNPLDKEYTILDISEATLKVMREDVEDFYSAQLENINASCEFVSLSQIGHDFWLTRNRHGAGFWDGDYPDHLGRILTDASHVYGSFDLYVGDDGKIYN